MFPNDPIMQKLSEQYPPISFEGRSKDLLQALVRAVIGQQLSVKAARTISGRFKELFAPNPFPTAEEILRMDDEKMRGAGLSYAKISYVKSIANAFVSDLIDQSKVKKQSDEDIITELTQIKGVGRWTAEMVLIFTLERPDVFSIDDLGVRNAIIKLYGITDRKAMIKLSEKWTPNRSSACWYLWRSLENTPIK
jgi:DNA-3-methyladenine glycosylase II